MGPVKEVGRGWIKVSGFKAFHNGDGLCFFNRAGELEGYRVNRVEGNRVFLFLEGADMPSITAGTELYRNYDLEFEKVLSKESATRKIGVDILFEETADGYKVTFTDEDGLKACAEAEWKKEDARTPQQENIRTQLGKTGNTGFEVQDVEIRLDGERFIPSSLLSDLRRQATAGLEKARLDSYVRPAVGASANPVYPVSQLTYLGNVMNAQARTFYQDHGVKNIDDAFEKNTPDSGVIMFCRHCIKNAMGLCSKNPRQDMKVQEPLYLVSQDGRRFRLRFDCSKCQMEIMY
jgi:putative protease